MSSIHKYPKKDINISAQSNPILPINADLYGCKSTSCTTCGRIDSCMLCINTKAKNTVKAIAGAIGFFVSFPNIIAFIILLFYIICKKNCYRFLFFL